MRTRGWWLVPVDRSVKPCGKDKSNRIDLGLEVMFASGAVRPDGLTLDEIACWCGCSRTRIWQIEQRALRKLRARAPQELLAHLRGGDF